MLKESTESTNETQELHESEKETQEFHNGENEDPTVSSPRPHRERKPRKPAVASGTVYLLLEADGKYKELNETELQTEGASVVKDPTLRLVKGQYLVPKISFGVAE